MSLRLISYLSQGTADLALLNDKGTAELIVTLADALWSTDPRQSETAPPVQADGPCWHTAPADRVGLLLILISD